MLPVFWDHQHCDCKQVLKHTWGCYFPLLGTIAPAAADCVRILVGDIFLRHLANAHTNASISESIAIMYLT